MVRERETKVEKRCRLIFYIHTFSKIFFNFGDKSIPNLIYICLCRASFRKWDETCIHFHLDLVIKERKMTHVELNSGKGLRDEVVEMDEVIWRRRPLEMRFVVHFLFIFPPQTLILIYSPYRIGLFPSKQTQHKPIKTSVLSHKVITPLTKLRSRWWLLMCVWRERRKVAVSGWYT